ncbi:hypothetical protein DFJ73DRAFT_762201 [Zopfochytrium polystomum]|nr:hypothetical protein DFJ73DRAFT_762201 [Zopfochytrium polystomum]
MDGMEIEVDEMDAVLEFVVTRWTIGDVQRKGDCLPNHIAASNADAPPEHSHASSSAADDVQRKRARHASTLVTENIQLNGAVQAVQASCSVAKEHQTQPFRKQRVTRTEHVSIFKNAPSVEVTNRIAAMYENANLAPGTRKNRSLVEALYTGFVRGPEVKATTSDIFSVEVTAVVLYAAFCGIADSETSQFSRKQNNSEIMWQRKPCTGATAIQELTAGPSTTQLNEKATWFKNLGRTGQLELVSKSFSFLWEYASVNPLFNERRRRVEGWAIGGFTWQTPLLTQLAPEYHRTPELKDGDKGDIVGKEACDELLRSCEQKILDGLIGDPFEGVDDGSLFTKFIGGLNVSDVHLQFDGNLLVGTIDLSFIKGETICNNQYTFRVGLPAESVHVCSAANWMFINFYTRGFFVVSNVAKILEKKDLRIKEDCLSFPVIPALDSNNFTTYNNCTKYLKKITRMAGMQASLVTMNSHRKALATTTALLAQHSCLEGGKGVLYSAGVNRLVDRRIAKPLPVVENDTVEAACLQIEEYTSATTSTARRKAICDTLQTALTDEADQKFWDKRGTAPFLPRFDINEIVKAYGNLSEFLMFVMTFAVIDPSIIKQKLVYFLNIAKFPPTLSLKITVAQHTPTRKNEKKST